MNSPPRIAFAGDRDISVWVLKYLLSQQIKPLALFVSAPDKATHADALITLCPFLDEQYIWRGRQFRELQNVELLHQLDLDYVICIHFPYIIPGDILSIPRGGFINLHPAYLPYNRGWHTPSWAILEGAPVGATLHFMDEGVDTGDIVYQEKLDISPGDTAHTLYQRLKTLEFEVFKKAWPGIASASYGRISQSADAGTVHKRQDLYSEEVQKIDLEKPTTAKEVLQQLKALTTNDINEAAYYKVDGKRYRVQLVIKEM